VVFFFDFQIDAELFIDFIDESTDLLDDASNLLVKLEAHPNDKELIASIIAHIGTVIQPLPIEARLEILTKVALMSLTGESDRLLEQIKKFKVEKWNMK